jgi:hypothetical protein
LIHRVQAAGKIHGDESSLGSLLLSELDDGLRVYGQQGSFGGKHRSLICKGQMEEENPMSFAEQFYALAGEVRLV